MLAQKELAQIELSDISLEVTRKDIKHLHLSVHPPAGRVTFAAPSRLDLDTIRIYALSKLRWIRQQQLKLRSQEREPPRTCVNRESHYLWGKRYLLKVSEREEKPGVEIGHDVLRLRVRPGTTVEGRRRVLEDWYRGELYVALAPIVAKWEKLMRTKSANVSVWRMKTRWGSCSPSLRTIRINLDLAKKPTDCLEYIVVHELAHLIEPTHNASFVAVMDRFMPQWRMHRNTLNRLPLRHEEWGY